MSRSMRVGFCAGIVGPVLFAIVVLALTASQWTFLRHGGWSAVHRSDVEWPSLLALGPEGWLLVATFLVCGASGLVFGATYILLADSRPTRITGWLLGVLGLAVCLEAAKPDAHRGGDPSWHDRLHNAAYPLIPLSALGAATLVAIALRSRTPHLARASAVAVAVMALALAATFADSVAQLARYFFFAALLGWLEAVAVDLWRRSSPQEPH